MFEVQLNDVFSADYSVDVVYDIGTSRRNLYRIPDSPSPKDGIQIEIAPDVAERWRAIIEFGSGDLTELWTTPNPTTLLVVSRGAAYLVNAKMPGEFTDLDVRCARSVIPSKSLALLVVVEREGLTAVGRSGIEWVNYEITGDDLRDVSLAGNSITGLAWDPPEEMYKGFSADLRSGKHVGGREELFPT
jgi:hypothetical protein